MEKNVIYAYRDMVEGGKPQLLFYAISKLSRKQIEENFNARRKNDRNKLLVDGTKLLWIKKTELFEICITPERIIYNGKSYAMVPSASACVGMLVDYLKKEMMYGDNR